MKKKTITRLCLENTGLYQSIYRDQQCLHCLLPTSTQEAVRCEKCHQSYCLQACYLQNKKDLIHSGMECFICEQKNVIAPRIMEKNTHTPQAIILRYIISLRDPHRDPYLLPHHPGFSLIKLQNVPISYFVVLVSLWRQATMGGSMR